MHADIKEDLEFFCFFWWKFGKSKKIRYVIYWRFHHENSLSFLIKNFKKNYTNFELTNNFFKIFASLTPLLFLSQFLFISLSFSVFIPPLLFISLSTSLILKFPLSKILKNHNKEILIINFPKLIPKIEFLSINLITLQVRERSHIT